MQAQKMTLTLELPSPKARLLVESSKVETVLSVHPPPIGNPLQLSGIGNPEAVLQGAYAKVHRGGDGVTIHTTAFCLSNYILPFIHSFKYRVPEITWRAGMKENTVFFYNN